MTPTLRLRAIELHERPVVLRLPFRFGAATLTHAVQAFVRVVAEAGGRAVEGAAAELMVPKWFDKSPGLSNDDNLAQLRRSLLLARDAYLAEPAEAACAWGWSARCAGPALQEAAQAGLPALAAQFGPAQLDKAIADAALRAAGLGWCDGLRAGTLGDPWSPREVIATPQRIAVRHTVGLLDRLRAADPGPDPGDGLPATLEDAIAACGLRWFKIKLAGDPAADRDRLQAIAALLDATGTPWQVTLDGNENFAGADALADWWGALREVPALQPLFARTLLLEQPIARRVALQDDLRRLALPMPLIVDESDDHPEAFERAIALGYRGISSKACKGPYRSLASAARVTAGQGLVLSAEDLTCQAGLALQQDTLLAASLGVAHIERNGHHYADGFGPDAGDDAEAFARAHPRLYRRHAGGARLRIDAGAIELADLHVAGFASAVHPRWDRLAAMTPTRTSA